MNFIKGMCLGLIVGTGLSMSLDMVPIKKKREKSMFKRCLRSFGKVIENLSTALED